jgi:hypothetical protein
MGFDDFHHIGEIFCRSMIFAEIFIVCFGCVKYFLPIHAAMPRS